MDLEGIMPNMFFNSCNYSDKIIINSKIQKTDIFIQCMLYSNKRKKIAFTIHSMYGSPNTVKRT